MSVRPPGLSLHTMRWKRFPRAMIAVYVAPLICGCSDPGREIYQAIRASDVQKVKAILKAHPEVVNQRDAKGSTPLHQTAGGGLMELTKVLVANGADINAKGGVGETVLQAAVFKGDTNIVAFLVKHGADMTAKSDKGALTALHLAALMGKADVAEVLLAAGADPDPRGHFDETPLHLAVMKKHAEAVKVLLKYGADPNANDRNGLSPLQFARGNDMHEIADILERYGAVHPEPIVAQQILTAIRTDDVTTIQRLVGSKCWVPIKSSTGSYTLLHVVARIGKRGVAEYLLKDESLLNLPNEQGMTALHIAAAFGNSEVAAVLLSHHADATMLDKNGTTALQLAESYGHKEVADQLRGEAAGSKR